MRAVCITVPGESYTSCERAAWKSTSRGPQDITTFAVKVALRASGLHPSPLPAALKTAQCSRRKLHFVRAVCIEVLFKDSLSHRNVLGERFAYCERAAKQHNVPGESCTSCERAASKSSSSSPQIITMFSVKAALHASGLHQAKCSSRTPQLITTFSVKVALHASGFQISAMFKVEVACHAKQVHGVPPFDPRKRARRVRPPWSKPYNTMMLWALQNASHTHT